MRRARGDLRANLCDWPPRTPIKKKKEPRGPFRACGALGRYLNRDRSDPSIGIRLVLAKKATRHAGSPRNALTRARRRGPTGSWSGAKRGNLRFPPARQARCPIRIARMRRSPRAWGKGGTMEAPGRQTGRHHRGRGKEGLRKGNGRGKHGLNSFHPCFHPSRIDRHAERHRIQSDDATRRLSTIQ